MVPVGNLNGSSSTYYTDMCWISTATVRVVYRGCHYAHAYGGVSNAYASNDASNTHANVGSRLAFRGKIVRAQSAVSYTHLDVYKRQDYGSSHRRGYRTLFLMDGNRQRFT